MSREIGWAEHWEFMDAFCDVGSPEGLALLEAHLQQRSTGRGETPASASSVVRTREGDVSGSPLLLSVGMQASLSKQAMDCGHAVSEQCVKQSLNFEEEPHTNYEVEGMKEQVPVDGSLLELEARLGDLKLQECRDVVDSVTGGPYAGSGSTTATCSQVEVTNSGCDGTTSVLGTSASTNRVREEMLTPSTNPAQVDVCTPLPAAQGENHVFLLG